MSLLNRSAVRKYVLDRAKQTRPQWGPSRVATQAYEQVEARLRVILDRMIETHPTKGKTFNP